MRILIVMVCAILCGAVYAERAPTPEEEFRKLLAALEEYKKRLDYAMDEANKNDLKEECRVYLALWDLIVSGNSVQANREVWGAVTDYMLGNPGKLVEVAGAAGGPSITVFAETFRVVEALVRLGACGVRPNTRAAALKVADAIARLRGAIAKGKGAFLASLPALTTAVTLGHDALIEMDFKAFVIDAGEIAVKRMLMKVASEKAAGAITSMLKDGVVFVDAVVGTVRIQNRWDAYNQALHRAMLVGARIDEFKWSKWSSSRRGRFSTPVIDDAKAKEAKDPRRSTDKLMFRAILHKWNGSRWLEEKLKFSAREFFEETGTAIRRSLQRLPVERERDGHRYHQFHYEISTPILKDAELSFVLLEVTRTGEDNFHESSNWLVGVIDPR